MTNSRKIPPTDARTSPGAGTTNQPKYLCPHTTQNTLQHPAQTQNRCSGASDQSDPADERDKRRAPF